MIDHITLGVGDFARAVAFYDKALAPLGMQRLYEVPMDQSDGVAVTGYGADRPVFWLAEERPATGLTHIAFQAISTDQVTAFHSAALSAGGTCNGPPGLRPKYHPDYYAAFVLDPDGRNIEAVFHGAGA